MKFHFIDVQKANFPVVRLCANLAVSKAGFYAWKGRQARPPKPQLLALHKAIAKAHADSKRTYGAPRITAALRQLGLGVSRKTVAKAMAQQELRGRGRKRRKAIGTDSKHRFPIAENLVQRQFSASGPNQLWVGDITYVHTHEGWLYLATLLDVWSRTIIGWATSSHPDANLALQALDMAIQRRRPAPGLIHHSDRGSQYAATRYREGLEAIQARPSMSRRGDCYDNAMAESLNASIKSEACHPEGFITRKEARQAMFEYIEGFYNTRRLHSALGYRSPKEHEIIMTKLAETAIS